MSNRRRLIVALGTAGSFPFAALSLQPKKIYRIGYVSTSSRMEARDEAFRKRLGELGYVDGKNVVIEWRFTEGVANRTDGIVAALMRVNVDCIVTTGVSSVLGATRATERIPIVMATIDADPVELGLIASLGRPGGNVTGFTGIAYDLAGKRLELLRELVPSAKRVGMLVPAPVTEPAKAHYLGTETAARKLGMSIRLFAPRSVEELEGLIAPNADWRPEIL